MIDSNVLTCLKMPLLLPSLLVGGLAADGIPGSQHFPAVA